MTSERKISRETIGFFERCGIPKHILFQLLIREEIMEIEKRNLVTSAQPPRDHQRLVERPILEPAVLHIVTRATPDQDRSHEQKLRENARLKEEARQNPELFCAMNRDHVMATLRQVSITDPDCPDDDLSRPANTIDKMMANKRNLEPATVEFWERYGVPKHCLYQEIIRREIAETERRMAIRENRQVSKAEAPTCKQMCVGDSGNICGYLSALCQRGNSKIIQRVDVGTQTDEVSLPNVADLEQVSSSHHGAEVTKRSDRSRRSIKQLLRHLHKAGRFIKRLGGLHQVYF